MGYTPRGNVTSQREELVDRLETVERRVDLLENTLKGVVRETGDLTVSGPCGKCERCLMIHKREKMYCPECGEGRPM